MTTTNPYPDLPAPAGAVTVAEWRLDGGAARHFRGTKRGTAETPDNRLICVDIEGDQWTDATVDRYIYVNRRLRVAAAGARALAADLLAAADEIDALKGQR
jgi:hypothetical protein